MCPNKPEAAEPTRQQKVYDSYLLLDGRLHEVEENLMEIHHVLSGAMDQGDLFLNRVYESLRAVQLTRTTLDDQMALIKRSQDNIIEMAYLMAHAREDGS
jgi:hypothetical protein